PNRAPHEALRLFRFSVESVDEPGAGVSPVPAGGSAGDVESGCRFFLGKTGKIAQLDQLRLDRILGGESIERLIQRQKFFHGRLGRHLDVGKRYLLAIPAMPNTPLLPRAID